MFQIVGRDRHAALPQQIFIVCDRTVNDVAQTDLTDEVVFFCMLTPGIVKRLFRVLIDVLQFCQDVSGKGGAVVFTEQLHRRDRRLYFMDPLFDVFFVLFPLALDPAYFFEHGSLCHLQDLMEDLPDDKNEQDGLGGIPVCG